MAGLTILLAYHRAGNPTQNIKPFGRFEEWSDHVRSSIIWIGMTDPCESRKDIENADPVRILLGSLFSSWYEIFESRGIKVKELVDKVSIPAPDTHTKAHETLRESLIELAGDPKGGVNLKSLGTKLRSYKNRIEGGLRLEQKGTHQGTSLWCIRKINL